MLADARRRGRRSGGDRRGEGLAQISDTGELEAAVERAIEANPEAGEGPEGNAKAIGPIVGAVMKETKGRADGGEVTADSLTL